MRAWRAVGAIGEYVGQRNLSFTASTYAHVLVHEAELDYERMLIMGEERKSASDARIRASEETLRELRDLAATHSRPDSDLRKAGFDDLADRIASLVDAFEGDHIEFGREEHRRQVEGDDTG